MDRRGEHGGRQVLEVLVAPPIRAVTAAFAIAPNTATPTALPTERANMLVPVTTPRVCQSTD